MTAVIAGVGGWLPPTIVTNDDLCESLGTTDEWIVTRTGIRERRMITAGTSIIDLAVAAGEAALKSAGLEQVDTVIVTTTSQDRFGTSSAPEVAMRLGQRDAGAFDMNSACSGFVYGLATAAGLIAASVSDSVLLIGAEAFSSFVGRDDRVSAPIFGDGSGAVVLRRGVEGRPGALGPFDFGSDGGKVDLLAVPAGGARQRSVGLEHDTTAPHDWYLHMDGRPLFQEAVERMSTSATTALKAAGWSIEDVDWFVGHQANLRIVRAVAAELGVSDERVAVNIDRVGNTLSASIPLLLTELSSGGSLRPGHKIVLSAFGAGLAWGSVTLEWPDIRVESVA